MTALAGSVAFAHGTNPQLFDSAAPARIVVAAAGEAAAREDVWQQVSRGDGGFREPLELLESEPVTFTVVVDGQTVELTSGASTLAEALIEAGIVVEHEDRVSQAMGTAPAEGSEVVITRVGTRVEVASEPIAHETEERRTSSLPTGTRQVQTEGVDGAVVTTYSVSYTDGVETARTERTSMVAAPPVTEVVLIGTGTTAPSSSGSSGSSGSTTPAPSGAYTGTDPRSIARGMLSAYGWGDDQWSCLDNLWQKESNWNPYAQNPSSGAYGIPQSLPGNKMASAGSDWRTNAATQIRWGLGYIDGRYGSPCAAWAHSQRVNWY